MVLTLETPKTGQNERKILNQGILQILVIISLIAILAVRIYAIYNTVAIRTWDDIGYRYFALRDATDDLTIQGALDGIVFPNGDLLDHHRSIGYHSWLVFGLKLSLSGSSEQTLQLVNLMLLLIQGITLFLFGRWATKSNTISGALTAIYWASPIVFGLNRWVMTENHVMTALIVFGFLPAWLLTCDHRPFYRQEFLIGILAAWGMGIFGGLREYAVPSYILMMFVTIFALWWGKRMDAMWGFLGVSAIFFFTLLGSWIQLYQFIAFRVTQSQYFHPMTEWIPHAVLYALGPALTLLFGLGLTGIIYYLKKDLQGTKIQEFLNPKTLKSRLTPLHILWLANGFLVVFYMGGILASDNRPVRGVIMMMISLINFLLIGIRLFPEMQNQLKTRWFNLCLIGVLILSGTTLYHQLFIAFEGGKTYAHTGHELEYYNHPLYLRPLKDAEDMHVR